MMNDLINTIPKIILFLLCIYIYMFYLASKQKISKQTKKLKLN